MDYKVGVGICDVTMTITLTCSFLFVSRSFFLFLYFSFFVVIECGDRCLEIFIVIRKESARASCTTNFDS